MNIDDLPIPEEMKEAIKEHTARQQLSAESFKHDVQRLFEEAPLDHLVTLRHIFAHMVAGDDSLYAAYLEGTVATTIHHRFKVCPSCGKNHDEELFHAASLEADQPVPGGSQASLFGQEQEAVQSTDDLYRAFLQRCRDYGVKPQEGVYKNFDDPDATPVQCMNCGFKYVSLRDRMVKPAGPENCEGCVHKAKWG